MSKRSGGRGDELGLKRFQQVGIFALPARKSKGSKRDGGGVPYLTKFFLSGNGNKNECVTCE